MPTYRDYLWLQQYFDTSFAFGYCAAVISDCTPAQVLSILGAESSHSEVAGIAELAQVEIELVEQSVSGPSAVVAVARLDGKSTLLIQLNGGSFAVSVALMRPLLPDHEVVSHYLSTNADSQFIWWSNGERVADFELVGIGPVIGDERVVDLISEVGGIGIDDDAQNQLAKYAVQGAFALAERITGASVPAALFEAGRFTVAAVTRAGAGAGATSVSTPKSFPKETAVPAEQGSATP
ncbi:DUF6461 domain-containing protein [Rhodococcus erythropolis]|uniref:DUF6461 domain-containing protein n=1 Tax=Rhodococcus erythropolis TaxID=1833 RepID=UPI0029492FC2|nr:DUF6461 domain-containing protein [Rhodococcus erythropolis]MDV6277518.1 DUF6461 domain-containing protein [Rhodococcus erythropolis]